MKRADLIRSIEQGGCVLVGTYQESCPLGVLELRTSMQLTTICALGGPGSWNVRHLIVV